MIREAAGTSRRGRERMADRQVYQFRVTLREVEPPVWRVIQVPSTYSFWDLHVAIQDAMGWTDSHLHQFTLKHPSTGQEIHLGIDEPEFEDDKHEMDWDYRIADLFTLENTAADYWYDFGDNWRHDLVLTSIRPRVEGVEYPRCVAGERACPPEDVGGPSGYQEFLDAIADPAHERHAEYLEWAGGSFNPEAFSPEDVNFDDPEERMEWAFP